MSRNLYTNLQCTCLYFLFPIDIFNLLKCFRWRWEEGWGGGGGGIIFTKAAFIMYPTGGGGRGF